MTYRRLIRAEVSNFKQQLIKYQTANFVGEHTKEETVLRTEKCVTNVIKRIILGQCASKENNGINHRNPI